MTDMDKLAVEIFGAIPVGRLFGMPVFVDPSMAPNRIRFVDPTSGRSSDFPFPEPPQ